MSGGQSEQLERVLGVGAAVFLGLGSILGTGVFVSIGLAETVAGPWVIVAVVFAAAIATFNGMSSAQLAAAHPVSGGTYEYGHRFLHPSLGFAAGWMFLCAKSASAATAALGLASYLLGAVGIRAHWATVGVALGGVIVLTAIVMGGMRRSSRVNTLIVSVTLVALMALVLSGLPAVWTHLQAELSPVFQELNYRDLFHATALMFVAYTGYGRIATLGEEAENPRKTIPRAILATLAVSGFLYLAVAVVVVAAARHSGLADGDAAPLETIARGLGHPAVAIAVSVGALTAMAGVLLNLLLGLSRVLLAMGRRREMPRAVAVLSGGNPRNAVLVIAALIAGLVLIGDIAFTWSLSAFTVLVYYAITNLAALRLPAEHRLYSRWLAVFGLASCLFVAFWVDSTAWLTGLAVLGVGFVWRIGFRRLGVRTRRD